MQTLSGALCLEAHQLRRSRTTSRILGYISLHYFGASYLVLTLFRLSTENMCMLNGKTSFPIPNVLTAYYKDIKGIVCASGCTKSKVVKRKFEDHDDIPAPDPPPPAAAAPAAALDAAAAAASPTDGDGPSAGGEEPDPPATSPAGKGGKGAKPAGAGKKGGKGQG
jgi:hypothetical protein